VSVSQAGEVRSARLESVRAVAALSVLIAHVVGRAASPSLLERLAFGGFFGVYLFFALTGYLLFWPFVKEAFGDGRRIDLSRYAANRALRILPLYYVVLVAYLLLWHNGGTIDQWLLFGTFSENFSTTTILTVNPVMWSLVIELHFYALLPLLAMALARVAAGSPGRALAVVAALALASFALRWVSLYHDPTPNPYLRYSLLSCFMFFAVGMALALLRLSWERRPPRWLTGAVRAPELWLLGAVALWWVATVGGSRGYLLAPASFLLLGACVLPLRASPLLRALDWRPLALVGVVSYSIYLWHVLIVHELDERAGITGAWALLAVSVPVVLAVASASYLLVERPFLRMRRRWGSR
jgi:peptidoglycan/LPS O-acetylase OafA/YrhL